MMRTRKNIAILILFAAALLSSCALKQPAQPTPGAPTVEAFISTQGAQTLEAQSPATATPPPASNLFSSGDAYFLPYQTCFDLDAGQQTAETDPACDFKVDPDPEGAAKQMAFLPVEPAAFDINFVY